MAFDQRVMTCAIPKRLVERHGHSPIGHGAVGVALGDIFEFSIRSFVLEGVQQCNALGKSRTDSWCARDGEINLSESLLRRLNR